MHAVDKFLCLGRFTPAFFVFGHDFGNRQLFLFTDRHQFIGRGKGIRQRDIIAGIFRPAIIARDDKPTPNRKIFLFVQNNTVTVKGGDPHAVGMFGQAFGHMKHKIGIAVKGNRMATVKL